MNLDINIPFNQNAFNGHADLKTALTRRREELEISKFQELITELSIQCQEIYYIPIDFYSYQYFEQLEIEGIHLNKIPKPYVNQKMVLN